MSTVMEKKESGNKSWWKIFGTNLDTISQVTNTPIKPPKNNQPAHIDLTIRIKKGK